MELCKSQVFVLFTLSLVVRTPPKKKKREKKEKMLNAMERADGALPQRADGALSQRAALMTALAC